MSKKKKKTQLTPAKQGKGLGRGGTAPPEEHQFLPGQSGNPKGPPKRRTQLWVYINQFLEMTDTEIERQDRATLTQAQQIALRIVETAKKGEGCGSERLARYCVDRDEGKATEHLSHEFPEGCGVMLLGQPVDAEEWREQSEKLHNAGDDSNPN